MDNSKKNSNVPNLRFAEFDSRWELTPFSSLFIFQNGINTDSTKYGKGIKYISVGDIINNDYITYERIKGSVEIDQDTFEHYKVEYGDILFQRSSETVEDIGQANVYLDEKPSTFGGFVIRGKKIGDFDPRFINYSLKSPYMRKQTIRLGAGAQHYNIGQDSLCSLKIKLPTYLEQIKISKLLSLIDEKINTQNKIINKYESFINAIEDKLLWKINYKGCRKVLLKEILIESSEKSIIQNQYPILSSTVKGLFLQSEYFDKEIASSNNIGYKVVNKGDIIISPQNLWMGNITYNENFENGLVSPSYHVFEIDKSYNPIYVSTLLKSHRALYLYNTVSEQGASIVRRNLNIESFNELKLNVPSKSKQDEVSLIIEKLHLKLNAEKKYLNLLHVQKQYLLQNMFI